MCIHPLHSHLDINTVGAVVMILIELAAVTLAVCLESQTFYEAMLFRSILCSSVTNNMGFYSRQGQVFFFLPPRPDRFRDPSCLPFKVTGVGGRERS